MAFRKNKNQHLEIKYSEKDFELDFLQYYKIVFPAVVLFTPKRRKSFVTEKAYVGYALPPEVMEATNKLLQVLPSKELRKHIFMPYFILKDVPSSKLEEVADRDDDIPFDTNPKTRYSEDVFKKKTMNYILSKKSVTMFELLKLREDKKETKDLVFGTGKLFGRLFAAGYTIYIKGAVEYLLPNEKDLTEIRIVDIYDHREYVNGVPPFLRLIPLNSNVPNEIGGTNKEEKIEYVWDFAKRRLFMGKSHVNKGDFMKGYEAGYKESIKWLQEDLGAKKQDADKFAKELRRHMYAIS